MKKSLSVGYKISLAVGWVPKTAYMRYFTPAGGFIKGRIDGPIERYIYASVREWR